MEREIIELVANAGIAGLLAIVVIYWYRADSQERIAREQKRTEEAKRQAQQEREDKVLMMRVIEANTKAMTELREAILTTNGAREE